MPAAVKLETSLGSYAFPTEIVTINSFIGDFFINRDRVDLAKQYRVDGFEMKLQSIERTFIDKIFALCDYYMQGKFKRYSRHLYDIYKLSAVIDVEKVIDELYSEIRYQRKKMGICPSADDGVDVSKIITEFCDKDFYRSDYQEITNYFSHDYVAYEDTIEQMRKLAKILEK